MTCLGFRHLKRLECLLVPVSVLFQTSFRPRGSWLATYVNTLGVRLFLESVVRLPSPVY